MRKADRRNRNVRLPDKNGYFGPFGGRYVPETLVQPLLDIEAGFRRLMRSKSFRSEFAGTLRDYAGRPTALFEARRLSERAGARVFLKREDLAHTGSHKINNTIGQCLLARSLGKKRVIAETGAGQHGVATASAAALLGLQCDVYMGEEDMRRQELNVFRMRLLGARVIGVSSGTRTLKDAINEAMRDWVTNVRSTFYCLGSAVGPHPYPMIVRTFQSVIGDEAKRQMKAKTGRLPDILLACVGGGSNAIGLFAPFFHERRVRMIGVEAGGKGLRSGRHAAPLSAGTVGVLHGAKSYLMQDAFGQVIGTHSVSAGLDYPGVGPEHAYYKWSGRATYDVATDDDALAGFRALSETEGIIPALESSHAIGYLLRRKAAFRGKTVVVGLSGRGDKDVNEAARLMGARGRPR